MHRTSLVNKDKIAQILIKLIIFFITISENVFDIKDNKLQSFNQN